MSESSKQAEKVPRYLRACDTALQQLVCGSEQLVGLQELLVQDVLVCEGALAQDGAGM